jgi:hypothetical protein
MNRLVSDLAKAPRIKRHFIFIAVREDGEDRDFWNDSQTRTRSGSPSCLQVTVCDLAQRIYSVDLSVMAVSDQHAGKKVLTFKAKAIYTLNWEIVSRLLVA